MTDDPRPAEALAAIAEARRSVHDRIATHGWRYDLSYAAICAGMVGAQVLDIPLNVSGMTVGVLLLVVMFQAEARRTGVMVTGVSPRQARWVAIAMGLLLAGAMFGMVLARRVADPAVLPLIVAGVMAASFLVALIGSRVWRRVYRAEMRAGQ
ncbi:MAG: hypothetical protein PSV23_06635 [Brevundimonas sp.]|uniref:hypothetical protein n=1 Tax=Brevundimonas sp. TaxID=1871086 RepID=UPI0024890B35|nr:hypothetical protein [Brevundimonas sp.]MDI1326459.1 hypothetical protein [Brevundimonas sp.]